MTKLDSSPPDLPDWLCGAPVAEDMHARGLTITKATWLEAAYGSSNESVLTYDKDMREWVRRNFPVDPHEPVRLPEIPFRVSRPSEAPSVVASSESWVDAPGLTQVANA